MSYKKTIPSGIIEAPNAYIRPAAVIRDAVNKSVTVAWGAWASKAAFEAGEPHLQFGAPDTITQANDPDGYAAALAEVDDMKRAYRMAEAARADDKHPLKALLEGAETVLEEGQTAATPIERRKQQQQVAPAPRR